MTWVLESPLTIVSGGVLIEIVLLIILARTGRGVLMGYMGGVLAVTIALLVVERLVVTDRERVEQTLGEITAAAERNDLAGVLACVSNKAPQTQARIRGVLPQFVVQEARVGGDLTVRFDRSASTPIAIAKFTARVSGRSRREAVPYENFVGRFTVTLQREGDRWLVADYDVQNLR